MENKLRLKYPVIVEGKYDKSKVCDIVSTPVIALNGFGIFRDNAKRSLISKLSRSGGVILLTDSDSAGNFIRARLKGIVRGNIINVYSPCIYGKERRKEHPSADGILGVEGMSESVLYELLAPYAVGEIDERGFCPSRARFYSDGLLGSGDSAYRRRLVARALGLPESLTSKALFEAVSMLSGEEEYIKALEMAQKWQKESE